MEAPVDSDTDDGNDEPVLLPEGMEEEVHIDIHFHCEHCIKMYRCEERPKPGWSCELEYCPNRCGQKFHVCKTSEHILMCSHERVPCINAGYGCPMWMQRRFISDHLPLCPASVVICNAEWNRWALGAKEREKVSIGKGLTALYDCKDLDMALALRDQALVNEMHNLPKRVRYTLCNGITRRFPCLPLTVRGSRHETVKDRHRSQKMAQSSAEDDEDGLTPGLSVSVCTELLRGKKQGPEGRGATTNMPAVSSPTSCPDNLLDDPNTTSYKKQNKPIPPESTDDISALCCTHRMLKSLCMFCRDDPDEPDFKMGVVWRERFSTKTPGEVKWVKMPCVEKVRKRGLFGIYSYKKYDESDEDEDEGTRIDKMNLIFDEHGKPMGRTRFQTPPPAPLNPKGLTMELPLKHYSRHQTKPKPMFTFQCMQELRRSEYSSHYQNVHSEVQEGLDGWLIHRCPLHVYGCPYVYSRLHPGRTDGDVVYSEALHAFGIRPVLPHEPALCGENQRSRFPCVEKTTNSLGQMRVTHAQKMMKSIPEQHGMGDCVGSNQCYASNMNLMWLPFEVLQNIARYLDGFSLNSLSLTCRLLRDICALLLTERGLVIMEWVRYIEDDKIRWREGRKRRFFSKSFQHVQHWGFKDTPHMASHLEVCVCNNRQIPKEKFAYVLPRKDGTILPKRNCRNCNV